MKRTKRVSLLLIVLVLIASLFAACAGGIEPAAAPAAADPAAADAAPADGEPLEISMIAALYSDPPDMENAFYTKWQELTNTKMDIEWVPSGDFHTKYALRLSAGSIPEVSAVPDIRELPLLNAIENGAFWDLTETLGDMSKYPNFQTQLAPDAFKYLSYNGRIYALPRSRSRMDTGLKIRKDWLDKFSLAVPTTVDEYIEALKVIVNGDPDGNGQNDTIGLLSQDGFPGGDLEYGFGVYDAHFDADGGFIPPLLSDEYTEFVKFMKMMYDEGLLAPEFAAIKNDQAIDMFTTGLAASYHRSIWWDYDWEQSINKVQPGAVLLNLNLTGPKQQCVQLNTGVSGGYYISSAVLKEKMERLVDYFDVTASQEVHDLAYFGVEGVHFEMIDDWPVLNELGVADINVTAKGIGCLAYAKWGKVDAAAGTKEYNLAKRAEVEIYDEVGVVNVFNNMVSKTWLDIWPTYKDEQKSLSIQAAVGQIPMEQYEQYIADLRARDDFKQAFQEFAVDYENYK